MDAHSANVSYDLLYLILAKILRRLSKLGSSAPGWLSDMVLDIRGRLQDTLDVGAAELQATKLLSPHWNPSEFDPIGDAQLSLPNVDQYIRNTLANIGPQSLVTPFRPKGYRRGTLQDFLSSTYFDRAYSTDPFVALYDVERSVENKIDQWITHVTNVEKECAQVSSLMDSYLSRALVSYTDNPEYRSIMILTSMELWLVLDKLVVEEIPMLAEYSPEIPLRLLESLLLRDATNLHRLSHVYQYLYARHSISREGFSVLSDRFTEDSLPVRYHDSSPTLQRLKDRIEMDISWRLTLRSRGGVSRRENQHDGRRQLDDDEHINSVIQVPPLQSKAIAFELQCPVSIRMWRSTVAHLLYRFDRHRMESFNIDSKKKGIDGSLTSLNCNLILSIFRAVRSASFSSPFFVYPAPSLSMV